MAVWQFAVQINSKTEFVYVWDKIQFQTSENLNQVKSKLIVKQC